MHGPRPALAVLAVPTGGNDLTWRSPRPTPGFGAGGEEGGGGVVVKGGGLALIYRFLRRLAAVPPTLGQAVGLWGIPQQLVGFGERRGRGCGIGSRSKTSLQPLLSLSPCFLPLLGSLDALNGCGGPAQLSPPPPIPPPHSHAAASLAGQAPSPGRWRGAH